VADNSWAPWQTPTTRKPPDATPDAAGPTPQPGHSTPGQEPAQEPARTSGPAAGGEPSVRSPEALREPGLRPREAGHVQPPSRPPIGREIRHWRRARGLTLAQLGEASALNTGYLSQIENDKALPSLDALVAIAAALGIPAAWLLIDAAPAPRVVRAGERPPAPARLGGTATEVDGGTARDLSIIEAVAPPGSRTGVHAHAGDEHHVVLAGRWRMTQGDHAVELEPGDYLAWDPSVPHDVECIGPGTGRLLVICPRHGRLSAGESARS
jgi:transcriptional regulator with XRE-family HTH domain